MAALHWNDIVFGPIHSRRLGNSLGINLSSVTGKICNFDCIYCECGWNKEGKTNLHFPTKEDVADALEHKLSTLAKEGTTVDSITFSGNGEPTLHPDFPSIIDKTIALRDHYFPMAKVSVLSNATRISHPEIRAALMKVDNPILKLDGADIDLVVRLNKPVGHYSIEEIVDNLKLFKGNFILQTMFLRGIVDGRSIDNTDPLLVEKWVEIVLALRPREVMAYTIDRGTPEKGLEKVSVEEMTAITRPISEAGIIVQIRG